MSVTCLSGRTSTSSSSKRALFVREYLKDLNATQAAIRAGYSKHTAKQQGQRLLTNVDLRAAVEAAQAKVAQKLDLSAEMVTAELVKIAQADLCAAFNADGSVKALADMPDDLRRAITQVDLDENGRPKRIKVADKVRWLELLARHLGMLTDNLNVRGHLNLSDEELNARIAMLVQALGKN